MAKIVKPPSVAPDIRGRAETLAKRQADETPGALEALSPEAARILGDAPNQLVETEHSVSSRYFEVRGLLRLDDLVVQERSLVVRDGLDIKTLWRERIALPPVVKTASLQ